MFAAGAVLGLLSAVVPHGAGVDARAWAINSSLGLPVAAGLWANAKRIQAWVPHVLIVTGGLMVSLSMVFGNGGSASVAASFFYVWVAVYVCWFFSSRAAMIHLTAAATVLAGVLAFEDVAGAPAIWLLVMGTATVVGAVVSIMRRQLIAATTIDPLTGVPTRQVFAAIFDHEVARARRRRTPLCLCLLDLDGLKAINDAAGHAAGDEVLATAARAWRASLRESDLLVRFGGDEFVALLPHCDRASAEQIVSRLRGSTDIAFSCGAAWWREGDTADDVLRRADGELYKSKRAVNADARAAT
jgi:diguanylate cyclase (GGDEF)-like protein